MSQHDHLLKRLCAGETLTRARELLQIALSKTGPGTGHDLEGHSTGLPAICAFIASQELRNNDVTKANAQISACMNKAVFEKCYRTVRSALGVTDRRRRSGVKKTYEDFCNFYYFSKPYGGALLGWLRKVENAVRMSDKMNINAESTTTKCAIFFWVYNVIEPRKLEMVSFAEENQVQLDKLDQLCTKLNSLSTTIRSTISQESKKIASSPTKLALTPSTSPHKSPSKRLLRELPSKDSPKKRKVSLEPQAEPAKTDTISNDVEMASLEEDEDPLTLPTLTLPTNDKPVPSNTPRNSPVKRPQRELRELPSRDAKKPKLAPESEPRAEHVKSNELLPQTPTKAHKNVSPLKAATALDQSASSSRVALDALCARRAESSSPTRRSRNADSLPTNDTPLRTARKDSIPASPSKRGRDVVVDVPMQDDASSDEDEPASEVRRRFRPVFLDRRQWFRQDPRLERILKEAEKFKRRREQYSKDRLQDDVTMED